MNWPYIVFFTAVHFTAFLGLFRVQHCSKETLFFAWALWPVSGFGVTAGAHRLWAHRTYEAHFLFRLWLILTNSIAYQGSTYSWAINHRIHHQYAETSKFALVEDRYRRLARVETTVSLWMTIVASIRTDRGSVCYYLFCHQSSSHIQTPIRTIHREASFIRTSVGFCSKSTRIGWRPKRKWTLRICGKILWFAFNTCATHGMHFT